MTLSKVSTCTSAVLLIIFNCVISPSGKKNPLEPSSTLPFYLTPHIQSHFVLLLPCLCYKSFYILPVTNLIQACSISHLEFKISLLTGLSLISVLSIPSYIQAARAIPNDLFTLLKIFQWQFNAFKKQPCPCLTFYLPLSSLERKSHIGLFTIFSQTTYTVLFPCIWLRKFLDTQCICSPYPHF